MRAARPISGEHAVLKLMFGALIRTMSGRAHGLQITEFERRQLDTLRQQLAQRLSKKLSPLVKPHPTSASPPRVPAEPRLDLLRASIALVWLATAVTCLHPFFAEVGTRYLAQLGLGRSAMYVACAGEGALGLYLLVRPFGRALAFAQIGVVAFFTFVLAWLEPMLLVSPFDLLSKNVPLVLVVWATARLASGEDEARVLPVLRVAAAIPWLTEGLFPKLLFQQEVELSMVSRVGLGSAGLVVGALGVLQVASFVLAFVLRAKALQWLLVLQFAALLVLPLVVGALAPWLWVHPFGPFSKNLPILAATWIVLQHERMRASPTSGTTA